MLPPVLPRFEVLVGCPEPMVAANIARCLATDDCECHGWVEIPYAELHVPDADRHFWSPRLQLTFDERADGTLVHCTFRPEPGVWTGFVFAHSVLGTLALIGLSLGLAQWTLGQPPLALLATPLAAALSLALYVGALLGHRLGHEQMCMLRRELDRALGSVDPDHDAWDPTADAELPGSCRESRLAQVDDLGDEALLVEGQQPRRAARAAEDQAHARRQLALAAELIEREALGAGDELEPDRELERGHQRAAERAAERVEHA